jgi:glycosyltransferase involved in cell wall biosynthesis
LTALDRKMIERRLREVDLVIGCSEYITKTIRCSFPEFAERWARPIQSEGVDVNRFVGKCDHNEQRQNEPKRLLFVGRISPEKGVHVLLDAFQKVVEHYPQAKLELVGPTHCSLPREFLFTLSDSKKIQNLSSLYEENSGRSYFFYLQKKLLSLNIAKNVTFTDFVSNLQVVNNYQAADVLVNPSFSESFGRSLIEAMACQVPAVATRVGGMEEIVEDGKTGILVEPGDASALAKAILCLLSDEDLRKSMGKAARKRAVELFSWEKTVENLLNQYKKICEENE